MYILVGLGNPGRDYSTTRHNIGFIFLDYLADKEGLSFKESKWQAEVVKDVLWGKTVLLVKPQTYMNKSGTAVSQILHYYQVETANLIVVHDDLDLPFGRIKIVTNRGDGGHKGIRSIIQHLGGTKDFVRIRVGIGRPDSPVSVSNYVLSRLSPEEQSSMQQGLQDMEEAVRLVMEKGIGVAMNRINSSQ